MTVVPRGVRNHNPGNLVYVETIQWQGQTGHDGRFCTFDSAANGIRALCKQLLVYQDKYSLRTIRQIISRWAPPSENDTEAYIRSVAHFMVTADGDLLELHNDLILSSLATAIIKHENGQQPYADDLIRNAARRALGGAFVPDIEPVDIRANDTHTAPPDMQPAAPIVDHSPDPATLPAKEEPMQEQTPSFDWGSLLKVGGAIASAFNPFIGAAIGTLGPIVQEKIEKEIGRHTDAATAKTVATQLSAVIEQAATQATGKADPVAAVAELRANPAAVTHVEQAVEQKLVDMAPLLNEMHRQAQERYAAEATDRNDAAGRVAKVGWNIQRYLVLGAMGVTGLIVLFLLVSLVVQIAMAADHLPDPTLIAFAGPILVMAMRGWNEMYAFAFGGTQEGSPAASARLTQARQ